MSIYCWLKERWRRSWGQWKLFGHFWPSLAGPFLSHNLWSIMVMWYHGGGVTTRWTDHKRPGSGSSSSLRPKMRLRGEYFCSFKSSSTLRVNSPKKVCKVPRSQEFQCELGLDDWMMGINYKRVEEKYALTHGTGHNTITTNHRVTYTDSDLKLQLLGNRLFIKDH